MDDWVDVETCDRHPSAVAAHFAVLDNLYVLALCGHCGRKHEPALIAQGWEILHALVPVRTPVG